FRALLDVAHPNLVTLHELISDGRSWFIVMEYVDGTDFLDFVRGPAGAPVAGGGAMAAGGPDEGPSTAHGSNWPSEPMPATLASGSRMPAPSPQDDPWTTVADRPAVRPSEPTPAPWAPVPAGPGLGPEGRARLRRALAQLASGLAALHRAGKLHRDIQP